MKAEDEYDFLKTFEDNQMKIHHSSFILQPLKSFALRGNERKNGRESVIEGFHFRAQPQVSLKS